MNRVKLNAAALLAFALAVLLMHCGKVSNDDSPRAGSEDTSGGVGGIARAADGGVGGIARAADGGVGGIAAPPIITLAGGMAAMSEGGAAGAQSDVCDTAKLWERCSSVPWAGSECAT